MTLPRPLLTLALLGGLWIALPAQAQSVRLVVNKVQKKNMATTHTSAYSREQSGTETIYYTIEVHNRAAAPIEKLKVRWAILIRTPMGNRFVEGEKSGPLAFGQKLVFDTEKVELEVTKWESTDGYSSRSGSELAGYAVQVFDDAKLLVEECAPRDTADRVEALRAAAQKKRHRF